MSLPYSLPLNLHSSHVWLSLAVGLFPLGGAGFQNPECPALTLNL